MIAYFNGKSLVSKIIKWRTWGSYSHVAWIVDRDFTYRAGDGRQRTVMAGTIYESWHKKTKGAPRRGVRKGFAGDLHKAGTPVDLCAVELSDERYAEMLEYFEQLVLDPRAKYGFRGVLSGFALRKNTAHGKHSLFCSQLLMTAFNQISLRFLINIEPYQTSPEEMSHSPIQRYIGSWKTGTPFVGFFSGKPVHECPEGWR
jgi:hypothetical protein